MPQSLGERNSKRGSKRNLDCFGGEISTSNSKRMKPICPKVPKFADINQNYLPKEQHPQPSGFITMKRAKELVKAGLKDLKNSLLARKSTGLPIAQGLEDENSKRGNKRKLDCFGGEMSSLNSKRMKLIRPKLPISTDINQNYLPKEQLPQPTGCMPMQKAKRLVKAALKDLKNSLLASKSTGLLMKTTNNLAAKKSTGIPIITANYLVARKSTGIPMIAAKEIMKEALKEFKSSLVVKY